MVQTGVGRQQERRRELERNWKGRIVRKRKGLEALPSSTCIKSNRSRGLHCSIALDRTTKKTLWLLLHSNAVYHCCIKNRQFSYCCQATTLKRTTKKTSHMVFTVSSPQALQFQYIILIPYILDDYKSGNSAGTRRIMKHRMLSSGVWRLTGRGKVKGGYQNFGRTCCLQLQGKCKMVKWLFGIGRLQTRWSFETSVSTCTVSTHKTTIWIITDVEIIK
jgi:hypothetical protein